MKVAKSWYSGLLVGLLFVALLAVGCGGGGSLAPDSYILAGRVVEQANPDQGIADVVVTIERGNTKLGVTTTNEAGEWTFAPATGTVSVIAYKEGFHFDTSSIGDITGTRKDIEFLGVPDGGVPQAFIVVNRVDFPEMYEVAVHSVRQSDATRFAIVHNRVADRAWIGDPVNRSHSGEASVVYAAVDDGVQADGTLTIAFYDEEEQLHVVEGVGETAGEWVVLGEPSVDHSDLPSLVARERSRPLPIPLGLRERTQVMAALTAEPEVLASAIVPLEGDAFRRVYFGSVGDRDIELDSIDGFVLVHDVLLEIRYAFSNTQDLNQVILQKLGETTNFRNMYIYYRLPGREQVVDAWPVDGRDVRFDPNGSTREAERFNEAFTRVRTIYTENAPFRADGPADPEHPDVEWADIEIVSNPGIVSGWNVDVSVIEVSAGLQQATGFTLARIVEADEEAVWAPDGPVTIGGDVLGLNVTSEEVGLLILGESTFVGGTVNGTVAYEGQPDGNALVMLMQRWVFAEFFHRESSGFPDWDDEDHFWQWMEEEFGGIEEELEPGQLYTTRTDTAGFYEFAAVEPGLYVVAASAYRNGLLYAEPTELRVFRDRTVTHDLSLVRESYDEVDVEVFGSVRDAVTNQGVASAEVSVWYQNNRLQTVETGVDGTYELFVSLPQGSDVDIVVDAEGYSQARRTWLLDGPEVRADVYLSPILGDQQLRIVLSWGAEPRDLDSHLLVPASDTNGLLGYHLYYLRSGAEHSHPFATLDTDETQGYGPETVTIFQRLTQRYSYYVHRYWGAGTLAGSGAQVVVYGGAQQVASFTAPASGDGDYWHVFDIDEAGNIIPIDVIMESPPVLPETTYAVSGRVTHSDTGAGVPGVEIRFYSEDWHHAMTTEGASKAIDFVAPQSFAVATTDSEGYWSKSGLRGWVDVAPYSGEFTFVPSFEEVWEAREDVDFVAHPIVGSPGAIEPRVRAFFDTLYRWDFAGLRDFLADLVSVDLGPDGEEIVAAEDFIAELGEELDDWPDIDVDIAFLQVDVQGHRADVSLQLVVTGQIDDEQMSMVFLMDTGWIWDGSVWRADRLWSEWFVDGDSLEETVRAFFVAAMDGDGQALGGFVQPSIMFSDGYAEPAEYTREEFIAWVINEVEDLPVGDLEIELDIELDLEDARAQVDAQVAVVTDEPGESFAFSAHMGWNWDGTVWRLSFMWVWMEDDDNGDEPTPPMGILSGYVYDALTSDPVAGATVEAIPWGVQSADASTSTDASETDVDGGFLFTELPAGLYQVVVSKEAYATMRAEAYVMPGEPQHLVLGLIPEFIENAFTTVAGVVRDAIGSPVSGALVTADGGAVTNEVFASDVTDQQGRFDLGPIGMVVDGSPLAQVTLMASKDGYQPSWDVIDLVANEAVSRTLILQRGQDSVVGDAWFADDFEQDQGWMASGFWRRQDNSEPIVNTLVPTYVTLPPNDTSGGRIPHAASGRYTYWYGDPATGSFIGEQCPDDYPLSGGTSFVDWGDWDDWDHWDDWDDDWDDWDDDWDDWDDDWDDDYDWGHSGLLVSPEIDLMDAVRPVLRFWTWFEIESVNPSEDGYDIMEIGVTRSTHVDLDDLVYDPLRRLNPYADPIADDRDHLAFTSGGFNRAANWIPVTIDLSDYRGSIVRLCFFFDTVDQNYNGFRGWFIDDVTVYEGAVGTMVETLPLDGDMRRRPPRRR